MEKKLETIGLCARIDYGSRGFRSGLVNLGFQLFENASTDFNILNGGLVSYRDLLAKMPNRVHIRKPQLKNDQKEMTATEKKQQEKQQEKAEAELKLLQKFATDLSEAIPKIKKNGKLVKLYVVTSEAYDGWIGQRVAELLSKLRPDIKNWGHVRGTFPLQKFQSIIVALNPRKAVWRGDYYSTVPDRLVKDEMRVTPKKFPDLYIVGCLAASLQRPKGEKKVPRISVGALHKLQDVNASENFVGVSILRYREDKSFSEEVIEFKTLTGQEREMLKLPKLPKIQQKALATIIASTDTAPTLGMLEDRSGISRLELKEALTVLEKKGIVWCNGDDRYDVSLEWLQKKTIYKLPESGWQEDRIAAFACLHAGYDSQQKEFFENQATQHMIDCNTDILVGAGDFIAGIKHDLPSYGEVTGNYTDHEKAAGNLVFSAMLKVFRHRMDDFLKDKDSAKLKQEELMPLLKVALMQFVAKEGNHDMWVIPLGFTVLNTFMQTLKDGLIRGIYKYLNEKNVFINLDLLESLVDQKVVQVNEYTLPSGLGMSIHHFHAGRMGTSSGWPQKALEFSDKHIVIFGNFHVAECVREWTKDMGQRVSLEVPTLLARTLFETNKGKKTDVAVGFLKIKSVKGLIIKSEVEFLIP
ncbi:MAG: hypothetical protein HYY86_02780 [Candidatus Harrisonbacteria bacterium]|nr:hypothetical protein [Candidatus Harrisonbacteria bacterium]